ncbi:DUF1704 domain-containing protein [Alteromonas pelagimontana]|uniref:DUF1704 domain-containing protein n=1 Tax=Alteromonas pelagimontana TaxID=1858656 RepID=A0A6M4M8Q1_9ALTE|nr:tyrosine/phenylalanine carboxypeptidase domain-containing protein [Alteromonas pelagimontana]QJR79359.1 DUF1704 domain-containing protein [Alteromonas pelagimontana]
MSVSELPAVASRIDKKLADIDARVDWLYYLSPCDNDGMWQRFQESDYTVNPVMWYPEIPDNFCEIKEALQNLPIDDVEDPSLHALFYEKRMELELQVDLVMMRESRGFMAISVELFGEAEPSLVHSARQILNEVPIVSGPASDANCADIVTAADKEINAYRAEVPDMASRVEVMEDLNSMMMVHHGHLKVAQSVKLPSARISPLIAHEVGTHVVTRYNGRCQPIQLLEHGLAHYDPLQEGLGTLAEYLAGYLPPRRLRVIAARVIATELALKRQSVKEIFHELHDEYHLPAEDAFDVAVRACRGGGLTKDSVYLRGLRELLAYLADGGDIEFLFLGKFAMGQRMLIKELLNQGWLLPPRIIPHHLRGERGRERVKQVRNVKLEQLFQLEPML